MKCKSCHSKPVRRIPDKSKKSVRVKTETGFNWVYPSFYSEDKLCLGCYHYKEANKPFKIDKSVDKRWSNIFNGDMS